MLREVKVGPPVITLNQGSTFMVTTEAGEIAPDAELGFFSRDTRMISSYRFFIQGKPWLLATSAAVSYYGARYYFVSPRITTPQGLLEERQLELRLERTVGGGVHEDFDITNYSNREVSFHFALAVESDFADIFEVKGHNITPRGHVDSIWNPDNWELVSTYRNQDFERVVICRLQRAQSPPHFGNGRLRFDITLAPGGTWHTCNYIIPLVDGVEQDPAYECHQAVFGNTKLDRLQERWKESTTKIITPSPDVQRAFDQAVYDMGALRLYEHDLNDRVWMPAAGVPWFVTMFGRDSLVVSLQTCW